MQNMPTTSDEERGETKQVLIAAKEEKIWTDTIISFTESSLTIFHSNIKRGNTFEPEVNCWVDGRTKLARDQ